MKIQLNDRNGSIVELDQVRVACPAWVTSLGTIYVGDTTDENAIPAISVIYVDGTQGVFSYFDFGQTSAMEACERRSADLKRFLP